MNTVAIFLLAGLVGFGVADFIGDEILPSIKRGGSCAAACSPCPRGAIDYSDPFWSQSCTTSNGNASSCADFCGQ